MLQFVRDTSAPELEAEEADDDALMEEEKKRNLGCASGESRESDLRRREWEFAKAEAMGRGESEGFFRL